MSCTAGVMPDDVVRAARGELGELAACEMKAHVETCPACALYASGLALMRDTWRDELARDTRWTRTHGERRLASSTMHARSRPTLLVLGLALGALAMAFFVRQGAPRAPTSVTERAPDVAPIAPTAAAAAAAPAVGPVVGPAESAIAPAPSAAPPERKTAAVLAGSRLVLAWSLTLDAATVATAHEEDATPWLDLHEGGARVETRHVAEIRTAQVTTRGEDAAWAVRARADATHVDVTRGTVTLVASRGLAQRAVLRAPASADVGSDGRIVVPPPPAVATPLDEQASFTLAEVDLARGDKARGRARLTLLVAASDLAIAGDAAFLLARTSERPGDRVAILGRYLARRPPSPYREQALVEQGHAFIDAGNLGTARAIAADLRADPAMPAVARPSLARLTARLEQARAQ